MNMLFSFRVISAPLFVCALYVLSPAVILARSQITVANDRSVCPDAAFMTIQDAVNAASPGDTVRVCKGTYAEQVTIAKTLTIEADSGAVLMPSVMQQNATSLLDRTTPLSAAILVTRATGVIIRGLVVDGVNNAITECSPRLYGILMQNASGTLARLVVRNFALSASLNGCQSGTGIFIQSGNGVSNVILENSTIHDFQKNGVTANESGTQVSIQGNVVTGIGSTTGAAQNGIQIGFGAAGSISRNTVTNNLWSPCTTTNNCSTFATNILVTGSDSVTVSQNHAGISQAAIFVRGNAATIEANETFATAVLDGIHVEGNQNQIQNNQIFNGAESGIFLDGNNNTAEHNTITEAAVGVLKTSDSIADVIRFNRFFGIPVAVQDPPSTAPTISPER
jgi:parallel beta-helix repeat protein